MGNWITCRARPLRLRSRFSWHDVQISFLHLLPWTANLNCLPILPFLYLLILQPFLSRRPKSFIILLVSLLNVLKFPQPLFEFEEVFGHLCWVLLEVSSTSANLKNLVNDPEFITKGIRLHCYETFLKKPKTKSWELILKVDNIVPL